MTKPTKLFRWVRAGILTNPQFLAEIVLKSFILGFVLPLLFARLGRSGELAHFSEQARQLVSALAVFWPAIALQYDAVHQTLGDGHAASFAFLSVALCVMPFIVAIISCCEYQRRRADILPPGRSDLTIVAICVAYTPIELFISGVGRANRLYQFRADSWDFFYFKHYALFFVTSYAVTYLVFLCGRFVIDRLSPVERENIS